MLRVKLSFFRKKDTLLFEKKILTVGFSLVLIFSSLFLNGCSPKPFLTLDGSYAILTISPSGMTQSELINLPWNTNMAIMQKFLLECSFVLSDLRTPSAQELEADSPSQSTSIQVTFTQPKRMKLNVDQRVITLDVQSLQIEVEGPKVGQVTINQTTILQGIDNPNLQSAFKELTDMLHEKKN
ncbi:MAG: hypothetical protein VR66_18140 [Peptococcaceae bacterium BRH_c23]|nr:MAG: hypothetical protein VR66_18140 [Peptococcaceae bacterium BRH_c23]KJS89384.1 MAG: hypothetical protein JL57_07495 [Desulfosporosinus sp. BICA1-9]